MSESENVEMAVLPVRDAIAFGEISGELLHLLAAPDAAVCGRLAAWIGTRCRIERGRRRGSGPKPPPALLPVLTDPADLGRAVEFARRLWRTADHLPPPLADEVAELCAGVAGFYLAAVAEIAEQKPLSIN